VPPGFEANVAGLPLAYVTTEISGGGGPERPWIADAYASFVLSGASDQD
jgi:hypothetical protein